MSKETCLIGLLILSIIALLIFIYSLVWSTHEYKVIEGKKLYKLWSASHLTVFRDIITCGSYWYLCLSYYFVYSIASGVAKLGHDFTISGDIDICLGVDSLWLFW